MLLEAVRTRIGHADFQKRKIQKKHEPELGSRPLQWNSKHLCNWANKLDIVQNGRPLASTGADFMTDHLKVTPAGYLDKRGCRAIFIQVSQQTRLRSLFIKYSSQELDKMLSKASRNFHSCGEKSETQETKFEHDIESSGKNDKFLLSGMLRYGFGGFDEMVKPPKSDMDLGMDCSTRRCAQQRLNHLTRELSALDDTADSIKLLNERKRNRSHVGVDKVNDECQHKSNSSRIQIGINAFFRPPNKDRQEVITLLDDTDADEGTKRKAEERILSFSAEKKLKK